MLMVTPKERAMSVLGRLHTSLRRPARRYLRGAAAILALGGLLAGLVGLLAGDPSMLAKAAAASAAALAAFALALHPGRSRRRPAAPAAADPWRAQPR
jgi:hypothetical protein